MDLLGAVSVLFGDCSMNPEDEIIFIKGVKATPEELEKATIKAKEVQAVYDSQEYARLRKAEYDQLNQFEMQFDDLETGATGWQDAINEIKARYPK
jgi:hypothetical protein